MNIRRHRRYTVQMAPYETYSFGADVEMSHHDLGVPDAELAGLDEAGHRELVESLTAAVLNELGGQLHDEIADAAELTQNQKSFLLRAFDVKPRTKRRPVK